MESVESYGVLAAAVSVFSAFIRITVLVALLAVVLGPVRRHRPDVSGTFLTGVLVMLATALVSPIVSMVLPFLSISDDGGPSASMRGMLVVNFLFTLANAGGLAMVIAGIARLATPSRNDPREPG